MFSIRIYIVGRRNPARIQMDHASDVKRFIERVKCAGFDEKNHDETMVTFWPAHRIVKIELSEAE